MKEIRFFIVLAFTTILLVSCASEAEKLLGGMTLEEKVDILVGAERRVGEGFQSTVSETMKIVVGCAGTTQPVERLHFPPMVVADGPAGLRIQPVRQDDSINTFYCTAFPVATLLSSTWNTELVEIVGQAIGSEARDYGVDLLLGPAMNIHRNPLCGRNFEYYSEDPLLSGKISAAMVRGIQSNGVGTSVKHFAANNQETNRGGNDTRVTPRALREIYLKGFEITVKEAQPWTIMTSYNRINGIFASENKELLTDILRDEWGFQGAVMTDWNGGIDNPGIIAAGNDLIMPGTTIRRDEILTAVRNGILSEKDINCAALRTIELVMKSPRYKGYEYSQSPDLKANAKVSRESAAEGMVLLKNEDFALPVKSRNIALFGITSYNFISGGSGSGDVNEAYTVSLEQGLSAAGYVNHADVYDTYMSAMKFQEDQFRKSIDPANPWAQFMKVTYQEIVPPIDVVLKAADEADIALLTIGRNSGEFFDRKLPDDFCLSETEQTLITTVCETFHHLGKRVVLILNIGGVVETASWKEKPDAILLAWQPGQEAGNAVADIITGKINPSGKLPTSFPVDYMDLPSSSNFPYDTQYAGMGSFMSVAPTTEKIANPEKNVDYTNYEEDIYVGYRYFDSFDQEVSYPFGFGLSYTTFGFGTPEVTIENDSFVFTVEIRNSGDVAGKEVVELYVTAPESRVLSKPAQELKAFAKTALLKPGESEILTMRISPYNLASFDEASTSWKAEAGTYIARFGSSSRDIRQNLSFNLRRDFVEKVHDVLKLQTDFKK